MPIGEVLKRTVGEVLDALMSAPSNGRGKRKMVEMFMDLPDRDSWAEYYEVIPEPRCINGVKAKLEKNGYRSALDALSDLRMVFQNALYYNEEGSQIYQDAQKLKVMLEDEWKKRPLLPTPRTTPPPLPVKRHAHSTSTSSTQNAKFIPAVVVPKSPLQTKMSFSSNFASQPAAGPSSDMEVDVGGPPSDNEGDGDGEPAGEDFSNMPRDAESDEIVRQLERGLPRWEGFGLKGWMEDVDLDRCLDILTGIKGHKDIVSNTRLASVLDSISDDATTRGLSFNYPLSIKLIEGKLRLKQYANSKEFDLEMARLFERGRRWYEIGSEPYGNVLLLQRLYQSLTSPNPPSGPPYTSQSNFASIRAGPGTARPLHAAGGDNDGQPGVTTFRVSTKDRKFVEEVEYKGWSVRLADWLHLANPDDPSRPIIAQVFKCWTSEEPSKKGQPGVTVCWYYRPEQTYHPANRQFWENEVFKTGHFADHPLDDIIEKIACQFTARHIRGRPRPPYWHPGWPLYVCDSRYNDRERVFVRIKNWNSCVPEEVRKSTEFMPIYPFERMVFPRRFASPFLTKLKGSKLRFPGGIGESVERADGEKIEGGGTGRKRFRKPGTIAASSTGPSKGLFVGSGTPSNSAPAQQQQQHMPNAYQPYPPQMQQMIPRPKEDRSVINAAGGVATLANVAVIEKLPPETTRHFERDPETNELLWFSGPPMDLPRAPGPQHSLNYLHYLAMKRKAASQPNEDSEESPKRKRLLPTKTTTEMVDELYTLYFGNESP